ncbi:MAG: AAA family ATPase [Butyricicoccus pullicaecorum]|nr:AAA family ATPase [Butyricicoccus pullicaecorum]
MTDFVVRCLEIQNFKGIAQLKLEFSDTVTHIYGDNATGKTTVYDALTWLLFGKDCAGNARFAIKPVGRKGTTPMVTAVCEVNGQIHKLRKVLRERWSKPRGDLSARYEGDTIEYTVDDVPKKETAYKKVIAEFVSEEEVFCLLTGVHRFARDLPWRERRRILAEVCGLPEDRAILEAAPQFAQLSEALGTRTVEAYKTALLIARKDANRTLDSLPIRMDECERRIAELADMDFEAAQAQQRTLVAREDAVRAELAGLASDTLVCQTQAEYQALLAEQKALEAENITYRNSQQVSDSRPALRAQLLQLENDLDHLRVQISRARTAMVQGQQRLESLKADKLAALQDGQEDMRKRLMESLAELGRLRAKAEQVLAARVYLEETRARLAELAGEKQRCDEKLRELDQQIALCEEFTRYKVQFLTHTVNCRFELAQFCLFREQINGGLAECCEVMVNGVPYADLNHAMQVNVGVDIIRTLSAHYGLHVPLVVDNAESVTQLQGIPTQVIRLVVSAADHVLRVETC